MINIDYTDRSPVYEQIINQIEKLIALGVLKPDEKLPSVRSLGVELSTNPNTVQKAYTMLESRGVIYSVKGIGNFVAKNNLKYQKVESLLDKINENFKSANEFGLNSDQFDQFIKKIRGDLYDNRK